MAKNPFYYFCIILLMAFLVVFIFAVQGCATAVYEGGTYTAISAICALIFWLIGTNLRIKKSLNTFLFWALLLAAAVLPRLVWIFSVKIAPVSDFETYYTIAKNLVENGTVVMNDYIALFPHVLGFPFVLSFVFKIFGTSVFTVKMFNVIIGTLTTVLVYVAGRNFFGEKTGRFAAFLAAFWPASILMTSLVCTEIIFLFCIASCLAFFSYIEKYDKGLVGWLLFAILGLMLGFSNAIRPVAFIPMLAIILYKLVFAIKNKKLLGHNAMVCAIMLAVFLLCGKATHMITEKYTGLPVTKQMSGYSIYVGFNTESYGAWNESDAMHFDELSKRYSPTEVHRKLLSEAVDRIFKDIPKTAYLIAAKQVLVWGDEAYGAWWNEGAISEKNEKDLANLSFSYYIFVLVLAFLGCFRIIRKKNFSAGIFYVILLLGIIAGQIPVETQSRYRFYAIAALSVLAALSLDTGKE